MHAVEHGECAGGVRVAMWASGSIRLATCEGASEDHWTRLRGGGEGKAGSVATSHTLSEVAAAEFQLGKLATCVEMRSVRDMVRACTDLEYINPTCSSNVVPPQHEINK